MSGRDPSEAHRASTPLELLFDLTFVVAVARTGIELRNALAQGLAGLALARYAEIFFGLWWAWGNFTWFASAYDTDDVPYRLLTLLQMAGVLVFAAGIPAAFQHFDLATVVAGYVIMRLALVAQWLRAARGHPEGRAGTLRYAAGVTVVQLCWIGWLFLPAAAQPAGFLVLVAAELAVPAWAEFGGRPTPGIRATSSSGTAGSPSSCSGRSSRRSPPRCRRRWTTAGPRPACSPPQPLRPSSKPRASTGRVSSSPWRPGESGPRRSAGG
jgi:low temperature requirement protein LtrA